MRTMKRTIRMMLAVRLLAAALICVACGTFALGNETSSTNRVETLTPQAPRTLVCRMGGEMRWSINGQFNILQTQINGKDVRVPVLVALVDQIFYARASEVAKPDGSNVQPGFCGFTDRVMTASDPNMVINAADDFLLTHTVRYGNGSTLSSDAMISGGSLNFQNKQAFTMQVLPHNTKLKVVAGTKPKAIK